MSKLSLALFCWHCYSWHEMNSWYLLNASPPLQPVKLKTLREFIRSFTNFWNDIQMRCRFIWEGIGKSGVSIVSQIFAFISVNIFRLFWSWNPSTGPIWIFVWLITYTYLVADLQVAAAAQIYNKENNTPLTRIQNLRSLITEIF